MNDSIANSNKDAVCNASFAPVLCWDWKQRASVVLKPHGSKTGSEKGFEHKQLKDKETTNKNTWKNKKNKENTNENN